MYQSSLIYQRVISWWTHRKLKILLSKMHFIYLTYQTIQLGLTYLKCTQNNYISQQLGRIISTQVYFIIKYWASRDFLVLYWKWKAECSSGYRIVVSVSVVCSPDHASDWESRHIPAAQYHEGSLIWHVTSPGTDQNLKLKYDFYWVCITVAILWSWKSVSLTIVS